MEEFKSRFDAQLVVSVIRSRRAPAKLWSVPPFMKTMPAILQVFMGDECYEIYTKLDTNSQKEALAHIENCGQEIARLLKCPLYEDWNEEYFDVDLQNLKKENKKLYDLVEMLLKSKSNKS